MRRRFMIVVAVASMMSFVVPVAGAAVATAGNPNGVQVRMQARLPNNSGQDANDLEITIYQKEKGVAVNGAKVDVPAFPRVKNPPGAQLVGGFGHTDGLKHGIVAPFEGAVVRPGALIDIDAWFWITKENQLWLDYQWTKDGQPIGRNKPGGFKMKKPRPGGNGGHPASQGGGGGSGYYIHDFIWHNDKDADIRLQQVQLFASMAFVDDISTLDWASIPTLLAAPVTMAPDTEWTYPFETTGDYDAGHVYMRVDVDDEPVIIYFDHPTPEPAMAAAMVASTLCIIRRRRTT